MARKYTKALWGDRWTWAALLAGAVSWVLVMVRSGLVYEKGIGFWGPNGHDGVWHIALAESLARESWEMPTFAGETLKNYHVGFDLLLAVVHRLTGVGTGTLYFQVFPVLIAMMVGVLVYVLLREMGFSKRQRFWAMFFVYFGGGWGWLVNVMRSGSWGGESMFWSQQAVSTLINPPFALSLVVMLGAMILLQRGKIWWAALAFGMLIQIKAYAGVLALGGLGAAGLYELWQKRGKRGVLIFILAALISGVLFVPLNRGAGGFLIWKPGWFLETMMQLTDRVGWMRLGEAMVNYKYGNVWWKAIPAYGLVLIIFWYGNMGTRMAGEFTIVRWIRNYRALSFIKVMILLMIGGGFVLPMFLVQKGTAWNTIQFFYYSLFWMAILAGVGFGGVLEAVKSSKYRAVLMGGVVFFTLPTTMGTLAQIYLTKRPPARISLAEKEALEFLAGQSEGVVLTYPFDEEAAKREVAPKPLYAYVSTAYVSAYSRKPVFLEDEMNLEITGYDWRGRRAEVENFYASLEQEGARKFLKENNISYIYWVKPQRARLGEGQLGLERVFENSEVDIYKVVK